jgi:hypothetical protein
MPRRMEAGARRRTNGTECNTRLPSMADETLPTYDDVITINGEDYRVWKTEGDRNRLTDAMLINFMKAKGSCTKDERRQDAGGLCHHFLFPSLYPHR